MKIKQTYPILIIAAFSFCTMCKAQVDELIVRSNVQWHIVSGSVSKVPFELMPAHLPVRIYPLKNGQWIWTTNMDAILDNSVTDQEIDYDKERQVRLQERQHIMDEIDPPGIAHVPEYHDAWNGGYHWNTNMAENWWGVWTEDTNTGWRVSLRIFPTNAPNVKMTVHVGSIVTNSGAGLMGTPDGKYAKLELLDANGKAIPTKRGAALNLYQAKYAVTAEAETEIANKHPVSSDDASVERDYPDTISDLEYVRWKKGTFLHFTGFVSNGPPCHIGYMKFNDIFSVEKEGDYTLTVQPVLYRMHYDGGTFQGYLDRVDLPSVSAKIHLMPSQ